MKCRICARECPPGAKICRDCAAARKRAFAATVTQPLLATAGVPSIGQPRFAPRPAKPRLAKRPAAAVSARSEAAMAASAAEGIAAPVRLGLKWLVLGLAIAMAVVYLLIRVVASNSGPPSGDAATPGDAANSIAAPAVSDAPAVDAGSALPATATSGSTQPGTLSAADGTGGGALKNLTPKQGRRKATGKIEVPLVVAEPPPAPKVEPAPAPRPTPRAVEAPRDPWQAMNEGLSRCAGEDWFSRGACEQRLRLQYCPDHWGSVAQCPIGPATDRGQ